MSETPSPEPRPEPAPAAQTPGRPQRKWRRKQQGVLPERLLSVDALRGFDMFWIVGAAYVISALEAWSDSSILAFFKYQLTHAPWDGFRFYDLIFPLFVFIVGVSAVLSIRKTVAKEGKGAAARRIVLRGALLFVVGLFYSGGLSNLWPEIRLLGVLQRIALCYTVAGLLFLLLMQRARVLAGLGVAILVGYYLMMWLVPIRDIRMTPDNLAKMAQDRGTTNVVRLVRETDNYISGQFDPGYNVANHFDFRWLPGRLYDTYWDPEGILSTFPAIVTCLMGMLAAIWLTRDDYNFWWRAVMMIVAGCICLGAGWSWGLHFPVIKKVWSSSFVLLAGGFSLVLLGLFFLMVDVWKWQRWCQPFIWIGSNAITMYLAAQILNFRKVAERLVGGDIRAGLNQLGGGFGDVVLALFSLLVMLAFARFLHRRQIFIRL